MLSEILVQVSQLLQKRAEPIVLVSHQLTLAPSGGIYFERFNNLGKCYHCKWIQIDALYRYRYQKRIQDP